MEGKETTVPTENEAQGPIHYITVEVPSDVLWSSDNNESPGSRVLEFLKRKTDSRIVKALETKNENVSGKYAFRGFVRQSNIEGRYGNDWEDERYNAKYVEGMLHEFGREKFVRKGETNDLLTTRYPVQAMGFAVPRRKDEVGYLVIYDNQDGLFNHNSYLEWVNSLELQENSTLRDRIHAVVVIKPEHIKSRLQQTIHLAGKLFK